MKRLLLALCALSLPVMASVKPVEATELPCAKYHALMRQHGLPVRQMAWIMSRESKCEPRAVGWNYYKGKGPQDCLSGAYHRHRNCAAVRSHDVGLFQINSRTWDSLVVQLCGHNTKSRILMRPSCNVKVAGAIYKRYGLEPWKGNSNG